MGFRRLVKKVGKGLKLATGLQQPRIVKKLTLKSTAWLPGSVGRQIHRVNQFGVAYGEQSLRDLRHPTLKGVGRMAVSVIPVGAVALLAYDAKRMRDRRRSGIHRFRLIKRQALMDAGAVEGRIRILRERTSISPLYDSIIPPGDIVNVPWAEPNTALPGPNVQSFPAPGQDTVIMPAPAPEDRGNGGDAAEGTRTVVAGAGKGIVALVVIAGLLAAVYASKGAK